MNFENTEHAYKLKSNRELFRALYLFKLISNQRLVAFLTKVAILAIKFKLPIVSCSNTLYLSSFVLEFPKKTQ